MNSAVRPIFNIFFLNKVVVGPMNSVWTIILCAWTVTLSPTQKHVHKKKKKKTPDADELLFQPDPNSHLL